MSIKAMVWAWEQQLPATTKIVLLKLADHANDEGDCWPAMANVAKAAGVSQRTAIRHIKTLERVNLLQVHPRFLDGKQRSNLYKLSMPVGVTACQEGGDSVSGRGVTACHTETKKGTPRGRKPETGAVSVPHEEIVNLYNRTASHLQTCLASRWPGSAGAVALAARWKESPAHQDLEWWQSFFKVANENPTWNGDNRIEFRASLAWLVKRSNFDKVVTRWAESGVPS